MENQQNLYNQQISPASLIAHVQPANTLILPTPVSSGESQNPGIIPVLRAVDVPEPSAVWLGLAGLGRRRRK